MRDIEPPAWRQLIRDSLGARPDSAARAAFIKRHPAPNATVKDVANHVEYIRRMVGIDHVGLGGDYDGTTELPDGMGDVSGFPLLFAELIRRGWSDADLHKLAGDNILRVLRDVELVRDRLAKGQ
jgi:membrane dipeptidase